VTKEQDGISVFLVWVPPEEAVVGNWPGGSRTSRPVMPVLVASSVLSAGVNEKAQRFRK
jgi:hypothetical protein